MPQYASIVDLIAADGADAWDIHYAALDAAKHDPDVLVLSVGDPDFATPAHIIDAMTSSAQSGDTHYTPVLGINELRACIAQRLSEKGASGIIGDNIAVLAGAQNALFAAAQCTLEPGDEVITFDPAYVTYAATVGAAGATLVRIASDANTGFRPDLGALENAITPRTRAIAFSNPNNPSGVAFTTNEMQHIGKLAKQHDLWIWSDEVYADLCFQNQHVSLSHFSEFAERSICIGSLSKSHAMTGWRVGWIAGPKQLIAHLENLNLCMLYGLPEFVQKAAVHALSNGEKDVKDMHAEYRARRDLLVRELNNTKKLNILVPEAGMFLLVDVRDCGLSSQEFVRQLYHEHKVSVLDGAAFSPILDGFVRLSFTNSKSVLSEACSRIKDFVSAL